MAIGTAANEPNATSSDYNRMVSYWDLIDAMRGGVEKMRQGGTLYLPRLQEENSKSKDAGGTIYDPYMLRLARAPFTNIFGDIVLNLSSKPFAKELKLDEKTPQNYKDYSENIDSQGNSLHVFAEEWFTNAVEYSISWVLVDYTKAIPVAGRALSIAEEKAQKLRPYWVQIPPKMLKAVYTDYINGVEVVTHARIDEPTTTLNGFIERKVQRIRVFNREPLTFDAAQKPSSYGPPTWAIWESTLDPSTNITSWIQVDGGALTIPEIPMVKFITGRRQPGTFVIDPALRDIAFMQVYEYQQESNIESIITQSCFPMLSGNGVIPPADGVVPVGPRAVLFAPVQSDGTAGSWDYVEPAATSIKVAMDKLENTRNEMRDLGKQPLTMTNLTVITTGQVAVKANSLVQAWAIRFKDAVEQCWKFTAMWIGDAKTEPEIIIHTDFNAGLDDGKGFDAVMKLRTNNDISASAAIDAAVRYSYLPDGFDKKADEKLLADEAAKAVLNAPQTINPLTGQPIAPLKPKAPPVIAPKPAPSLQ